MQEVFVESTVRATLIAAVIGLVLYVMRIKTASARHTVWAGVVVVMLLLPAFLLWGPKASLPVLPKARPQNASAIMPVIDSPVIAPSPPHSRTEAPRVLVSGWSWRAFFLSGYLLGLSVLL